MKERPILFSAPMVRAILEGRKTMTRRVVKYIPLLGEPLAWCAAAHAQEPGWVGIVGDYRRFCPYGLPGDRLWVRETWGVNKDYDNLSPCLIYQAMDGDTAHCVDYRATPRNEEWTGKWRPSIHMPRWASRITLEVIGVRVERLCDISMPDVLAEGCMLSTSKDEPLDYKNLWDSLNALRGYGWDKFPYVWVIEFKRVTA